MNVMVIGNITHHLSPSLQQNHTNLNTAEEVWNHLQVQYSFPTVPSVYKDLKKALNLCFNPSQHPNIVFNKIMVAFGCIQQVQVNTGKTFPRYLYIDEQIQVMIILTALPAKWESLIPITLAKYTLEIPDVDKVRDMVVSQWETETGRGQHKGTHNSNKISAVKCKCDNPHFSKQGNQQQPSLSSGPSNQQWPNNQHGTRGSG
jgi:hypothetical protein